MKRFILSLLSVFAVFSVAQARDVIPLNDNWRFYFSSENSADYARAISLPHTWVYDQTNALISTQPTTANYIREFYAPEEWGSKRVFVKFNGVQSTADVMVNGQYVGEHRGGSTAFTFEITKYLDINKANKLHVIVNNAPQSDVLPTSHEEDYYGGIYRDVELLVTGKSIVSPLYYGSDGVFVECHSADAERAEGVVRVHLNSTKSSNTQLALSIFNPEGEIIFQKIIAKAKVGDEPVVIPFLVKTPKLWSLSSPMLYKFVASVIDNGSKDVVEVQSGLRTIDYSGEGVLKINGEPIQFRGVALYHDYPNVGGAASRRDIENDMPLIEELGANAIRSVSHPHHPYLYDLCDREGKMVWVDFPLTRAPFLSEVPYYPTKRFHEQGIETLKEIIAQNYNHPSVIMWGIFSQLTTRGNNPIAYIKQLNRLAKDLDSTRPTVAVSDQDGEINTITDLIVWNQSLGWDRGQYSDLEVWSDMLHSGWSGMRSAVTYGQNGRIDQQSEPKDYKSRHISAATWKPEGRQRQFHEEYAQRLVVDSLFWGVCINSMFDFKSARNALGENNSGLVTFDRRDRKDIFHLYKACWNSDSPTLHIANSRSRISSESLYAVTVYASDTLPPLLYRTSDTITMKRVAPWQFVADSLTLESGVNKFVVRQGELSDSVEVVLQLPRERKTLPSRSDFTAPLR